MADHTDNNKKELDHYHIWICDKGHTHTKLGSIFSDVSATSLDNALYVPLNKKTKK